MTDYFMESVKPSDFDLHHDDWLNTPQGVVARNIIKVCKKLGDTWDRPFLFQEYLSFVDDIRSRKDQDIFVCFVMDECITFEGGCYAVTKEFIRRYAKFVKKELPGT